MITDVTGYRLGDAARLLAFEGITIKSVVIASPHGVGRGAQEYDDNWRVIRQICEDGSSEVVLTVCR